MSNTALIVGIGNLVIGLAYTGLGLLSAWEAITQYRYRGLSRFGLGFSLMAASCGPHHLILGWCVLQSGMATTPMLAITLVGLPAGTTFVVLRLEAMFGGRGDRTVTVTPQWPLFGAVMLLLAVGALAGWSLLQPPLPPDAICRAPAPDEAAPSPLWNLESLVLLTNLCVTVAYAMVGWYLVDTQVRRYVASGSWSLSGLSLSCVFPTCAFMHLVHAFAMGPHSATLPFDLLGVPASIYFLWVVRQVHRDSVVDWNRRPLVGVAAPTDRSSPWSSPAAPSS
jgi:hypothetical protein